MQANKSTEICKQSIALKCASQQLGAKRRGEVAAEEQAADVLK
jgi:hypothetical protein